MFDTVKVDEAGTFESLTFRAAYPKEIYKANRPEGEPGEQKKRKDGTPVWKVQLSALDSRGEGGRLFVSVAMTVDPSDKFEQGQAVTLPGLTMGVMEKRDGSGSVIWWSADGIEPAATSKHGN